VADDLDGISNQRRASRVRPLAIPSREGQWPGGHLQRGAGHSQPDATLVTNAV